MKVIDEELLLRRCVNDCSVNPCAQSERTKEERLLGNRQEMDDHEVFWSMASELEQRRKWESDLFAVGEDRCVSPSASEALPREQGVVATQALDHATECA